jgi:hypothetical protein
MRTMLTAAHIGDTLRFDLARPAGAGRATRATVVVSGYDRPVVRISAMPEATTRQRGVLRSWLARGARP